MKRIFASILALALVSLVVVTCFAGHVEYSNCDHTTVMYTEHRLGTDPVRVEGCQNHNGWHAHVHYLDRVYAYAGCPKCGSRGPSHYQYTITLGIICPYGSI